MISLTIHSAPSDAGDTYSELITVGQHMTSGFVIKLSREVLELREFLTQVEVLCGGWRDVAACVEQGDGSTERHLFNF